MNYIINPLWFYFLDVVSELDFLSAAACIVCLIAIFIAAIAIPICLDCNMNTKYAKKAFKICAVALIISLIISIITPSKETMITMMVAQFATYENAAWTLDTVKAAVDYIVEAIGNIA